jgi:hypothetical protein
MPPKQKTLFTTILWVGLLVGCLDISCAFIQYSINYPGKDPLRVLRYIASALFGKDRAYSEDSMMAVGALMHFLIAYGFTILFFLLYPRIKFLSMNRLLTAVLYGLFIWAVMSLLVVPQTKIVRGPFNLRQSSIGALILIVAIGIPLSWTAHWFYRGRSAGKRQIGQ